jgi:hypothetical protein
MVRRTIGIVVAIAALLDMGSVGLSQTASPSASACQISPVVPAPAFPATSESPVPASPVASPDRPDNAVEPEVAAQVEQVARALAACLTDGNAEGVADVATADYLGDAFGGGERMPQSDYIALAVNAPVIPIQIVAIGQPVYTGMRTVAAEVELIAGNQLRLERWTFVFRDSDEGSPSTPVAATPEAQGRWMAHGLESLSPQAPGGATEVETTLNEYTITLEDRTINGPDIVLQGSNEGAEAHEMLVLQLSGGAAIESLLRPSDDSFPAGIEVVGQITLLPGEQRDLVLVELPAGEYHIVCLFPDSSGVPHLAFGQVVTFAVR